MVLVLYIPFAVVINQGSCTRVAGAQLLISLLTAQQSDLKHFLGLGDVEFFTAWCHRLLPGLSCIVPKERGGKTPLSKEIKAFNVRRGATVCSARETRRPEWQGIIARDHC